MSNELFSIYGFSFKPDTLYQVTEKLDTSAPEGFKEFKTTKIINPDIIDSVPGAIFDKSLGVWDTGLYVNSRALVEAIPAEKDRAELVKLVTTHVVKPLEKLKGVGHLSQSKENNAFWDDFQINIHKDRIFNTGKLDELLQLYLVVLHKQVTPKPLESNPNFKNSQFCIVDKEDSVDRRLEKEAGTMEAIGMFYNLLSTNKEDLLLILDYLQLGVSKNVDDKVLPSLFSNWLKDKTDGYQNYSVFIKTCAYFKTKEGERELFYHSKIKDLIKSNIAQYRKKEVWFEDDFIGSDLKSATKNVLGDKSLEERILKY